MFCPNCGTQLPAEAAFCANCGTKLQAAAEKPAQPAPVMDEPTTARPVQQPVPAPEKPVIVREPATARPAAPAAPIAQEPVSARPVQQPAPAAPKAPVQKPAAPKAPVNAADGEAAAPADYTVVNVILLVVSLLSCCSCVSIVSIVTSIIGIVSGSACKKAIAAGDLDLAAKKGKTAKTMWIISAVLLGLAIILGLVFVLIGSMSNTSAITDIAEQIMSELN